MDKIQAKKIVESLLYMTDHPLTAREILEVLDQKWLKKQDVESLMGEVKKDFDQRDSALTLVQVAGGYQVATKPDMAAWIRKLYKERLTVRLSSSALETLSIIAYKQPITRSEVEQIRGVEASGVMDTLIERRLVKVVGRKETIGRPLLYGTTIEFLRQFGLNHLSELPELKEIKPKPDSQLGISEEEAGQNDDLFPKEAVASEEDGEKPQELVGVAAETPAPETTKGDEETPKD